MNFSKFGQQYRHLRPRVSDYRVHGKYRKFVSRFGLTPHFQARLAKRARVIAEMNKYGNINDFFRQACQLVPGAEQTGVIFHLQLTSDPSVQFVVKDIFVATHPTGGGGEDEEEDEEDGEEDNSSASIDSVDSIGSHIETPSHFNGREGLIMMRLTEAAIAEGFERMLLGYFYDGRFLCMERAKQDYKKKAGESACPGVYEIFHFLHRHNIRHGDWLVPASPYNNLFVVEGLPGPVIGDFGNSSEFESAYERLNDLQAVISFCKKLETFERFTKAREEIGLPDSLTLSRVIGKLKHQIIGLERYPTPDLPVLKEKLKELMVINERIRDEGTRLSPEDQARATALYDSVAPNLSAYV